MLKFALVTATILGGFATAAHYDRQQQTCHVQADIAISGRYAAYRECRGRWGLTNDEQFIAYLDGER